MPKKPTVEEALSYYSDVCRGEGVSWGSKEHKEEAKEFISKLYAISEHGRSLVLNELESEYKNATKGGITEEEQEALLGEAPEVLILRKYLDLPEVGKKHVNIVLDYEYSLVLSDKADAPDPGEAAGADILIEEATATNSEQTATNSEQTAPNGSGNIMEEWTDGKTPLYDLSEEELDMIDAQMHRAAEKANILKSISNTALDRLSVTGETKAEMRCELMAWKSAIVVIASMVRDICRDFEENGFSPEEAEPTGYDGDPMREVCACCIHSIKPTPAEIEELARAEGARKIRQGEDGKAGG